MYHPLLLEHFRNPRNAGELDDPDAEAQVSNPVCGDILRLSIKAEAGRITAARFKCRGCVAAMACASAVTELAAGSERWQAEAITPADVEQAVGELPEASKHAAALAVDALRAVLARL